MAEILPEDPTMIPPERWKNMNMTAEEYAGMRAHKLAREANVPQVGSLAPDFEIERLSPTGGRTGEMFRLSQTRGRPVALVFGSYT